MGVDVMILPKLAAEEDPGKKIRRKVYHRDSKTKN
jgi:hypothetical protein